MELTTKFEKVIQKYKVTKFLKKFGKDYEKNEEVLKKI